MKTFINFLKRLWREDDSRVLITFKNMAKNQNFRELTEEEMKTIRSGPISSAKEFKRGNLS
ncbi:hypothetical protein [Alkalihalobacillus sp. BA299]|uniref:hypothetical protein n=1 Tax=Alkalihalobacillus sp. BA299 TaxID=2815938 RepID=UPI001ADB2A95|nr:hypothetical protein [Alkalihalobacillus sp. BA299]